MRHVQVLDIALQCAESGFKKIILHSSLSVLESCSFYIVNIRICVLNVVKL